MISELFGSQTTEKCLIYLSALGEGYPLEIAKTFQISNSQVNRTLNKLEQADILIGREMGRTRVYSLNQKWFLSKELKAMLDKVILNMPLEEQEKYFMKRKRPRKKNKVT
ncbi:MAG: winged helix-turn-helix transcriptional regulator [Bdellovibrionaceae bacterium]|nr:winged helix-turn-helix transcriptional regulator [Pseudobdellovibrionaceae bacterium]MBX3033942.1 winged helix-turn-helix transcriptional regulator [Pseudobdellovibrionaceae bacterium]